VGGKKYPLHQYEIEFHQRVDELGRPASRTHGGSIRCVLATPGNADPLLYQWMMEPTMQQDGKLRLLHADSTATLKTISFFNAYCTGLAMDFLPGPAAAGNGPAQSSTRLELQINPQRVAVGAIVHDNEWPLPSHGAGEHFMKPTAENSNVPSKDEEPSGFMEGLHTVLDVVGMIPVIGEAADLVNAGLYVAQGRYGEAALAAASAIPLAGNVVGAAKLGRRALKVADKLSGATALATKTANKALDAVKGPLKKLRKTCGDPVDVASGEVLAEAVDFSLPGPIPLTWERTWFSSATHSGAVGYGWSHAYEWAIIAIAPDGTVGIRDGEGRLVAFEAPEPSGRGIQSERLVLFLDAANGYRVWHLDERRWYKFGPADTNQEYAQPLQAIEDPNGFVLRFTYTEAHHLQTIIDSTGRVLVVDTYAAPLKPYHFIE
jgi:YD repeat-containing protein